jgi:hypothetical protein
MHHRCTKLLKFALTALAATALILPASAGAATVVNGDFETGNLSGWQQYNSTTAGQWFTYDKAEAEKGEFFPPIGNFAAMDNEMFPDTAILFQDVALEPFSTHQLTMTVGYRSQAPIVAPNTLAVSPAPGSFENQQLRVDVIKPTASIETLNPEDILATLFASKTGDSPTMVPTQFSANLSGFAGQTVRIRVANAVGDSVMNTMVDNVSIASAPIPNAISRGKLVLNKKKGTGKLAINVPGPGTLTAVAKGKKTIKTVTLTPTAGGAVQVPLNPTAAGRKALKKKGKLKAALEVTFTPTGGAPNTQTYKVTLKKTLKKAQR